MVNFLGIASSVVGYVVKNTGITAIVAISVVLLAVPGAIVLPILGFIGFSATGPVAASIAAGIQASSLNVVAGGTFGTLQSAAMGGYDLPVVLGTAKTVGVGLLGALGTLGRGASEG